MNKTSATGKRVRLPMPPTAVVHRAVDLVISMDAIFASMPLSGAESRTAAWRDMDFADVPRNDSVMPTSNPRPSSTFQTSVTATLSVRDWPGAMEFYKTAFGAIEVFRVEGGGVSQLSVAGAPFWIAEESPQHLNFSPPKLGGCSVRMLLIVEDPAALCAQAVAAGATQVVPVADDYGWRIGRIVDPFGHHWEIARPVC